jgi:hypothetical protein
VAIPRDKEIRRFYRSAQERLDEAELLFAGHRWTGAVYLAGYCIECMLKVLVLSAAPKKERVAIIASFKGAKAHDFLWLKAEYLKLGGSRFPGDVSRAFAYANMWTTSLRYQPGAAKPNEAKRFLDATRTIMKWADGRV